MLANLFKNRTFLAYYLDAIEKENERLFTDAKIGDLLKKLRPRVEKAAFLEGSFGDPSHTGRQFTNDEVARNGFEHNELRRGDQLILGIEHFVRMRHDSVRDQLTRIRREKNVASGSSGATFPVAKEDLPR